MMFRPECTIQVSLVLARLKYIEIGVTPGKLRRYVQNPDVIILMSHQTGIQHTIVTFVGGKLLESTFIGPSTLGTVGVRFIMSPFVGPTNARKITSTTLKTLVL